MAHPIGPQTTAAVQARVAAVLARRGAAGAQYLAFRRGELLVEHCHGFADALRARRVTPATTFNVYSITKPFTATTALTLARAARLDLDAPIGAAVGIRGLERFGTVRDTLLHRAGFPNPNPLRWIHAVDEHARFDEGAFVRSQLERLAHVRRRLPRSRYSNIGYLAAGAVIERSFNGGFQDAVRSCVFDRLHLRPDERLGFSITDAQIHARGHLRRRGLLDLALGLIADRRLWVERVGEPWVQLRLHHVHGSAYGGLIANARGLARFGQAILGFGDALSPEVRRDTLNVVPGHGPTRSLAWFVGALGRHEWRAHAGGGLGGYGELRIYPAAGAVSVLLTNGPGLRDARCLDHIDAAWLGD